MKKSEIYLKAQEAVLTDGTMCIREMLEILRELMRQEDLALFCEQQEEEKAEEA